MSEDGVAELIDFMPIVDDPTVVSDRHRIVRGVRGVRGEMRLRLECAPRFDYARGQHLVELTDHGAVLMGPGLRLTLHGAEGLERFGNDLHLTRLVRANELVGVILESGADTPPQPVSAAELTHLFEQTAGFWRGWIGRSTYRGRWREMVDRSAMTLKLLTFAPSGAMVAAPTAALHEQLGGERNWDYRFTWVRDASFSVGALLALGFREEALAFMAWLRDRIEQHVGTTSGPLKIMYRVDGSSDLTEETLDHLASYRDSRPVRIGNGAADQLQLDIYGEAMFALRLGGASAGVAHRGWQAIGRIRDWLAEHWNQPDERIWETRGGRKDFVYGRVMTWVAPDGAVRLARDLGRPADLARWTAARDAVYQQVLERGWNAERQAFVQYPGSNVLDASNLLMPITGFIVPRDPAVAVDTRRDRAGARLGQPGVPLRPERLARWPGRQRGDVLDLHVLVRRRARPRRPPRAGPVRVREDADLGQPRWALLRRDRTHGRAARQLPAGVQPLVADRRRRPTR
jgi:GH15 family glucan-1,4-alpha-glucosidase